MSFDDKIIDEKLPIAYCINLDREYEKYENIIKEFSDILEIKRVSAIDGKLNNFSGEKALYETNVNLFMNLINSENTGSPYIIIIEDDIYKYENFYNYWPKIAEFIHNPNNIWDFISLNFVLNLERPELEIYNDFLYKVEASRMTGFMICNIDFIKKNIYYLKNCGCLDMTMTHDRNFKKLIPKELIVKQIVNKISGTCDRNTYEYENYYTETLDYLNNFTIQTDLDHSINHVLTEKQF